MNGARPGLALRAPWYVLERDRLPWSDPVARRPALQKYDTSELVRRLVADPRDSLRFDPAEDRWSVAVPSKPRRGSGRAGFATHRLVHTPMTKLYQPNHDRFYAVAVELFCDEPGLPLPGPLEDVELSFVVRRERLVVRGSGTALRQLAASLAVQLDDEQHGRDKDSPAVPDTDDLDDLAVVERLSDRGFTSQQQAWLAAAAPELVVEAWVVGADGRAGWTPVPEGSPPGLVAGEEELPMWRRPPADDECATARRRSLWFGLVPTMSAALDTAGSPKLDDRSVYRIRCLARRPRPGRPDCPPDSWWSEPTVPYRLASFFDPAGTRNRRVSVVMPDFRALAARAGEPAGPGGVEIVRPPGSQLKFDSDMGTPSSPDLNLGTSTSRCTFAIELFTIVAMFVFSLFLPVVLLLFQLWWLLLLRFCWPPPAVAVGVLAPFFASGKKLSDLPAKPADPNRKPPEPSRVLLDDLLEFPGGSEKLADAKNKFPSGAAAAQDLVTAFGPAEAQTRPGLQPEPVPADPVCPTGPAGRAPP